MSAAICPDDATLREAILGVSSTESGVFDHLDSCSQCQAKIEAIALDHGSVAGWLSRKSDLPETFRTGMQAAYGTRALASIPSLPSGTVIGDYVIVSPLGRGGMGEVYRAKQSLLGREVAFKILPSAAGADPKSLRRFRESIKLTGQLDHPNIVRSLDASEIGGVCYLAMELVEGMDVDCVLDVVGTLSIADACEITRQAAIGLEHGHQQRCIHRDIKPANLLLGPQGIVKVTDFGLATLIRDTMSAGDSKNRDTMVGMMLGSPNYISPEQLRDPTSVDQRADIYSLGCTMYRMLHGLTPTERDQPASAFNNAGAKQVDVPLPKPVSALLKRMTATDPGDRPQTAGEIAIALKPYCDGAALPALLQRTRNGTDQLADPPSDSTSRDQRRPSVLLSIGGPLLMFVAALGVFWWMKIDDAATREASAKTEASAIDSPSDQPERTVWIVDDIEGEFLSEPRKEGWSTSKLLVGYGGSHSYAEDGCQSVRWSFANIPPGRYWASVSWLDVPREQAAEAAMYQVRCGDIALGAAEIDQRDPPDEMIDGQRWTRLCEFDTSGGELSIELDATKSRGSGLRADAARLERVSSSVESPE